MSNPYRTELEALARACCSYDYPEHFYEWEKLVERHKRLLLIASRDHGKTTFFSKLIPLYSIIKKMPDILLVSYSDSQVLKIASGIRDLCDNREALRTLKPEEESSDWSKSALKFRTGSRLDTLTFGSSGRGGHFDLIVVDDPVKDYGGMDPDEQENYFKSVLTPMVKPDGQMIVTGNYIYDGDLIDRIEKNPAYHRGFYPAISDRKALWPERWSLDRLEERRKEVGDYAFCREYLLEKISLGNQFFKRSDVRYYDPERLPDRMYRLLSVDPAISLDGDYTAIVVSGTAENGKTYLLDYANLRTDDVQLIVDEIFRLVKEYAVPYIQIETIGFQKMLKHWLYDAMRLNNHHFGIEEIRTHRKSKEARIMALQPRIQAGSLLFHPTKHEEIISQLIAFPRGRYDDLIDAMSFQVGKWDKPEAMTITAPQDSWSWWKDQSKPPGKEWAEGLNL